MDIYKPLTRTYTGKMIFSLILILFLMSAAMTQEAQFTDISATAGVNVTGDFHGVAVGDYDNDGLDDLFLSRLDGPNRLFKNMGQMQFTEVTVDAGLDNTGQSLMSLWLDMDNDGDLDLYLGNFDQPNQLFENNGDGTFTDISAESGADVNRNPRSVLAADFDADGYIDLYLANISDENSHLRNMGDGTFRDVTLESGATDPSISMGAVVLDYDNDNDPDLYLTHDANIPYLLYENDGQGQFTEIGASVGLNYAGQGMGVDFLDFNQDGMMDLYVTNLYENVLFQQTPNNQFVEIAASQDMDDPGMGWGVICLDYNNDMNTDIYICNDTYFAPSVSPNKLFRNNGNGQFTEVSTGTPLMSPYEGYGTACADFNKDGLLDIFVVNASQEGCQLFQNNESDAGNWMQIKLEGTNSNYQAIGTRVFVYANGIQQTDEVNAGSGYASQNSTILHFGLGDLVAADSVELLWPSGLREMYYDVQGNQMYHWREGDGTSSTQYSIPRESQLLVYQDGDQITLRVKSHKSHASVKLVFYDMSGRQMIHHVRGYTDNRGNFERTITGEKITSAVYLVQLYLNQKLAGIKKFPFSRH